MMTTMKQSTGDLRKNNDRKTVFQVFETDGESCGSWSSEDNETYSPRSVVSKARKWPVPEKDVSVDVFGPHGVVRNQMIERIRWEDSHLGQHIGECLIAKFCGAALIFSRPISPLSGK